MMSRSLRFVTVAISLILFSSLGWAQAKKEDTGAPIKNLTRTVKGITLTNPSVQSLSKVAVFTDDFESDLSNWTMSVAGDWQLTTEAANGGLQSVTDSPGGNYGNNEDKYLISMPFDFSEVSADASIFLSFYHKYVFETNYDFGYLLISTDGEEWSELADFNGTQSTFTEVKFDISDYQGEDSVYIAFNLESDGSATRDGWHIDDFAIDVVDPADVPPVIVSVAGPMSHFETGSTDTVWIEANDNSGIASVAIEASTDGGDTWTTLTSTSTSDTTFWVEMPFTAKGTMVWYYVVVTDIDENTTVDPTGDATYYYAILPTADILLVASDQAQYNAYAEALETGDRAWDDLPIDALTEDITEYKTVIYGETSSISANDKTALKAYVDFATYEERRTLLISGDDVAYYERNNQEDFLMPYLGVEYIKDDLSSSTDVDTLVGIDDGPVPGMEWVMESSYPDMIRPINDYFGTYIEVTTGDSLMTAGAVGGDNFKWAVSLIPYEFDDFQAQEDANEFLGTLLDFIDNLPEAEFVDWANTQWPPSISIPIGASTPDIFGLVWIDGVTSDPGPAEDVYAQLGIGQADTDPRDGEWMWYDAMFNTDTGNNDEYKASVVMNEGGQYSYVYRYSLNDGPWLYADLEGPVADGDDFSAMGSLTVGELENIVISEIHYNMPGDDEFEYIEIHNAGIAPVDLTGATFIEGVTFTFEEQPTKIGGYTIMPGEYWVITLNADTLLNFYDIDPAVVAGEFTGGLSNSGEDIILVNTVGDTLAFVDYDDSFPWPTEADGFGFSLEYNMEGDLNDPYSWNASLMYMGSPGAENGVRSDEPAMVSIADIQQPVPADKEDSDYVGEYVSFSANVAHNNTVNGVYGVTVQDDKGAWNGIQVFTREELAVGDVVNVYGTVIEYFGLTTIAGSKVMFVETGTPFAADTVVTTDVDESYESVLITILDSEVTLHDTFDWEITDAEGSIYIPNNPAAYTRQEVGTMIKAVTGAGHYAFGAYKIVPRSDEDIMLPPPVFTELNESFEGEAWPPEHWMTDNWVQKSDGGFFGDKYAYAHYNVDEASLHTPQVEMSEGMLLSVQYRDNDNYSKTGENKNRKVTGHDSVIVEISVNESEWMEIGSMHKESASSEWFLYEWDLSAFASPGDVFKVSFRHITDGSFSVYGNSIDDVVISSTPTTGTVMGYVTSSITDSLLANVNVMLLNTPFSTTTDANGYYEFPAVPEGTYEFVFDHADHYPGSATDTVSIGETIQVDMALEPMLETPWNVTAEDAEGGIRLTWNTLSGFVDGFEEAEFGPEWTIVEGSGTAGDIGGIPYWHIATDPAIAYEGSNWALTNWGYSINTWLQYQPYMVEETDVVSFNWSASYYWSVDPYDNSDLYVKVSTDGGTSWDTLWTYGEIGEWDNWVWYNTTLSLEDYVGQEVIIAFNLVGDDNADNNLDYVHIGPAPSKRLVGKTIAIAAPDAIVDEKLKSIKEASKVAGLKTNMMHFNLYKGEGGPEMSHMAEMHPDSTTYLDTGISVGQSYYYSVEAVYDLGPAMSDTVFVTYTSIGNEILPAKFALRQNYPNPFNPTTTIAYDLPIASDVKMSIYNVKGQKVAELINGSVDAGYQTVEWDGRNSFGAQVATGVYFYRIEAGNFVQTRKMILIK
jgi:hypothetical protein